jgi:triacylglycerol lipase
MKNIYRVSHSTDPVPMVPTWPFYHVPNRDIGYMIQSPLSGKPWEYHLMKHYIRSMESAGSWNAIARNRPAGYLDSTVERWLKSDGIISFTANTLDLLNAALVYVIKKDLT